jgi:GWxTD domain-containing protein
MTHARSAFRRQPTAAHALALTLALAAAVAACGGGGRGGAAPPARPPAPAQRSSLGPQEFDAIAMFRRMGLLAKGAPMPFVGTVAFFGTGSADSTHVMVAVSLANSALTFAREDNRFRAGYTVTIALRSAGATVKQVEAHENVVVSSFRETARNDESVLYEEILTVPPGRYDFSLSVRDDGSARTSDDNAALNVPTLVTNALSSPLSFVRAGLRSSLTSLPQVIANPTASVTFGRDTVIPFFIEAYGVGDSTRRLAYAVRSDNGRPLFSDSTTLNQRGALYGGTISIPVNRVGIGAMTLNVWAPGRSDTVRTPLFVGFGADLPLATYEEMVNYLRWFASAATLQELKDTPVERRPQAWSDFVHKYSDANGTTEPIRDYFTRMADANARFKEEASPGWMTDRGKVLLGLGRPDQVYEQVARSLSQQGRQQVWEYRAQNILITFYDQNGFGRWKLTPSSDSDFFTAWRRRVQ